MYDSIPNLTNNRVDERVPSEKYTAIPSVGIFHLKALAKKRNVKEKGE
jgi:hypothetical protein